MMLAQYRISDITIVGLVKLFMEFDHFKAYLLKLGLFEFLNIRFLWLK